MDMELKSVKMNIPEGTNIIIGQTHFIKTVEDLYEVLIESAPGIKFGLAFNEASQERLVRVEGNDEELKKVASENAIAIGAGHTFNILLKEAFPLNELNAVKNCPEDCSIFCATANQVEVIVAETELGRGILGVVDGETPVGVEKDENVRVRREFLRKIGYKR